MPDKETRRCIFRAFLLCAYLLTLFYFLLFAEMMGRKQPLRAFSYNLVPFQEIRRFIQYRQLLGARVVFLNLGGNILGFVPFGCLLPIQGRRFDSLLFITLVTFSCSLWVELLQLFLKSGSFDVDDLLLNTAGGMIGYGIYCLTRKVEIWRKQYRSGLR